MAGASSVWLLSKGPRLKGLARNVQSFRLKQFTATKYFTPFQRGFNIEGSAYGQWVQQPLLEVLQHQASLLAKLKGRLASDMLPLKLNFSVYGPLSELSWSPQPDLSRPSRWLHVSHLQYGHPGSDSHQHIFHSMTASLDLNLGRPALFKHVKWATSDEHGLFPAAHSSASASSILSSTNCDKGMAHSAWAAGGSFVAIISAAVGVGGQEPSDPNDSMLILADVAQHTTIGPFMPQAVRREGRDQLL